MALRRTTVLQLDADGTDSALDAAADCNALHNDVALDLCAIADQESEPMQEAVPAFVVDSDLAELWSCGTTLPMTSAALTDAFLSFSNVPLFVLINMSTSCFRRL
jgi:hypothetical protein